MIQNDSRIFHKLGSVYVGQGQPWDISQNLAGGIVGPKYSGTFPNIWLVVLGLEYNWTFPNIWMGVFGAGIQWDISQPLALGT